MAYSRWLGSRWYTYWAGQNDATENHDTALFTVCDVVSWTAKQLRDDLELCISEAVDKETQRRCKPVTAADTEELRQCIREFLADVDQEYPLSQENK